VADKDYYSFEEVLKNLKLEEDQLKRLVSAGEIRAFRDKDTMRFKAEDVDRLKGGTSDELVLDDDLELDLEDPAPAAKSAGRVEEIDLDGGDELVLDESAPASQVEELDLGGDDDEAEAATAKPGRARAGASAGGAAGRRATRVAEPVEEAKESVGTMAMLVVGFAILLAANFVVLDALAGRASNPISRAIANLFS